MKIIEKNLNSLQYLRVLAIFMVFFLHTKNSYAIGHFGVDIFFVISGYVMAMIAMKNIEPLRFMKDRIFRIVPLYWIATIAIFIITIIFIENVNRPTTNIKHLFLSMMFIPFYRFENDISPVFIIGWTLMFEMLFYGVMFSGLLARKYLNKSLNPVVYTFIFISVLTFVASFFKENSAITEFLGSQNSYIFLFGIVAYWLNHNKYFTTPPLPFWVSLSLIIIAIVICSFSEVYLMQYRALSLGLPAFVIVFFATRIETDASLTLPSSFQKALLVLADISYAFYITHIFILLALDRFGTKFFPILAPAQFLGFMIAFVLSLLVAFITHYWFDKPLNQWLKSTFNSKKSNKPAPLGQS